MKRIIAIFLAVYLMAGSLIPGNSFFELSTMPTFIKHYQFHKIIETPGISFGAFLKLHYMNSDHQMVHLKNHHNPSLQNHGRTVPIDEMINLFTAKTELCITSFAETISFPASSHLPDNQFSAGVFHPPSILS